ncbi:hypothetical protein E4656_17795 [Natronospirillum operosum]|uniref:Uncharacterized protein n=1 Tax=Natronospirillum operosum TaxID=2759953 RepID=A0A4Z0W290_9GAMM|nr:hypothetical protein [Natronospirillum operosum]TGG90789.1 hypothetical protein E4656_17795 [Natronospirillum operosum]
MDVQTELEALEQAITDAEERKRQFVKEHPNGSGDKQERTRLYAEVERARKALREYKVRNQLI